MDRLTRRPEVMDRLESGSYGHGVVVVTGVHDHGRRLDVVDLECRPHVIQRAPDGWWTRAPEAPSRITVNPNGVACGGQADGAEAIVDTWHDWSAHTIAQVPRMMRGDMVPVARMSAPDADGVRTVTSLLYGEVVGELVEVFLGWRAVVVDEGTGMRSGFRHPFWSQRGAVTAILGRPGQGFTHYRFTG